MGYRMNTDTGRKIDMANEEINLVSGKYLEYKGKPLVREGDTICYGDMSEKCILILEIISYKDVGGKQLPDKIMIQVIDSKDPNKIIRQGSYSGLHDAFTMGEVWLDQALKQ
jgi:hypothetical protein